MTSLESKQYLASVLDYGIWRNKNFSIFLESPVQVNCFTHTNKNTIFLGWGRKKSGERAQKLAQKNKCSFLLLEDGFIRSLGLGIDGAKAHSIVVDDLGIYYDCSTASRLEVLIRNIELDDDLLRDTRRAIEIIKENKISKYNNSIDYVFEKSTKRRILVVDQTENDKSISCGAANEKTFHQMLEAALTENPDAEIWIKTHPDTLSNKKRSYFTNLSPDPRIHLITEPTNPLSIIEQMDKVYVVTSQMGFEALLLGKKVICFGIPWYAGWGLTEERNPQISIVKERRDKIRSLEELFAAAYFKYTKYIHPESNTRGTLFDLLDWIILNKKCFQKISGNFLVLRLSPWKKAIVSPFLKNNNSRIRFLNNIHDFNTEETSDHSKIVAWGYKHNDELRQLSDKKKIPLWRMEDGFLRSSGLGSDLFRPLSLVIDSSGMYYDPNSKSELEAILNNIQLDPDDIARAQRFRESYINLKMSKYNLQAKALRLKNENKKVILVPGQVENDASIIKGSPELKTNLSLLKKVRELNPDAYIIYKEHPDVVAGNRPTKINETELVLIANQDVSDAHIIDCIQSADEIHTLTSLSGFEALIHNKKVVCYGAPFYAGWGLTTDHIKLPHRMRQLTLEEILSAVFFRYPLYKIPETEGFVSAEAVLNHLSNCMSKESNLEKQAGWLSKKTRKLKALSQMIRESI